MPARRLAAPGARDPSGPREPLGPAPGPSGRPLGMSGALSPDTQILLERRLALVLARRREDAGPLDTGWNIRILTHIVTRTGRRLRCGRAEQDDLCLRGRPQAVPARAAAR